MSRGSVLIAGFSGRALAQSARRAGYDPIVVDCFGDLDMRAAATSSACLPARVAVGFSRTPLIQALERLAADAPSPPIGLVLGAGFESNPQLIAALGDRFTLLGNSADVVRRVKNPSDFFGALVRLGIRHPETQLTPPSRAEGWLMKRIGGSGGIHIQDCPASVVPDARRYFQRRIGGDAISVLGVASPRGTAFGMSRQWVNPRGRHPYRYGGAAGPLTLEEDLEARLIDCALAVEREFGLNGLISLDFLVDDGEPSLIEVNARPGASLDVLDDSAGNLFRAHVSAFVGNENPADLLQASWHPPEAAASAYLYADRGQLTVTSIDWPAWVADRPAVGSLIAKGQPIATVRVEAANADAAEQLCREHLGRLEKMLYEGSPGETPHS